MISKYKKKRKSIIKHLLLFSSMYLLASSNAFSQKIHTSYLWHMDQPVYWGDKSKDKPESKQFVEESQRLKFNGTNTYPGSKKQHPTNDLQEIFSKDDRINAYQSAPRNAIRSIKDLPNAGAQLSISGGLLDNIQSLAIKNQWGYYPDWMNPYKEAISWKTKDGFPRLDVVSFSYDHAFSPFVSEKALKKQIQAHQYTSMKYYGYTSKGYWPAECAFSERIIKTLVECGIEWSVIANSHLARTLSDYTHPYNINGNIEAPNRADQVATKGINWFEATIDGRGSKLAAPYSYQAHKAQYIDPQTGMPYIIDVVPMCNYISYIDGYSGANVGDIQTKIEPFSNTTHPSIVLLAHDGDNAWGGGSSYYNEAVTSFSHSAAGAGYEPVTIQQFLKDHPVPADDIVRVEDGAWVNADSDWGHPQFINWMWPLYSKSDYRFDPNGWTEDARNWAVITATDNWVTMAEDIEGGKLRTQYIVEGGAGATNAEKAWHFYFGGLNSGFMYYGKAEDMEVKPSMTGNIAIEYAQKVINANLGKDNTAPSVFIPQRYPYNPGSIGFGPTTGYKKVNYSSNFHIWTFAYDVSGLQSVTLKYRVDNDGWLPVSSTDNQTYAGGSAVGSWQSIEMTRQPMAPDPTDDKELEFFILPKAKADLCYAEITGLKDKLVDYYVEAIDSKGNIFKTPIQHVYIGTGDADIVNPVTPTISWLPSAPSSSETITITCKNATAASKLHWGVNGINGTWAAPIQAYYPSQTTLTAGKAVESPFQLVDGKWQVVLGPFNYADQMVSKIDFVINHGNNNWDNNNNQDFAILVKAAPNNNPSGKNINQTINADENIEFTKSDFGFNSPVDNELRGIQILTLPTIGLLEYELSPVKEAQLVLDISKLVYRATGVTTSTGGTGKTALTNFTYRLIDDKDFKSTSYTANLIINKPIAPSITVSFKKPADWGNSGVNVWAWTGINTGNIFNAWPGASMKDDGDNWYSYTFDSSVQNVSVVFSKSGNSQTIDVLNLNTTTCFETNGFWGNKVNVKSTECDNKQSIKSAFIDNNLLKMVAYPQPVKDRFVVELPNISDKGIFTLTIIDFGGRVVYQKNFEGYSTIVEKGELNSGIYILNVTSSTSSQYFNSKLVIQ